jgi:hypothetical protein
VGGWGGRTRRRVGAAAMVAVAQVHSVGGRGSRGQRPCVGYQARSRYQQEILPDAKIYVLKNIIGICSPKYEACMVGYMDIISHTNLKDRMVISRIATSKNHIELLVPGQI